MVRPIAPTIPYAERKEAYQQKVLYASVAIGVITAVAISILWQSTFSYSLAAEKLKTTTICQNPFFRGGTARYIAVYSNPIYIFLFELALTCTPAAGIMSGCIAFKASQYVGTKITEYMLAREYPRS
jgi:hypothetical protein